MSNKIKIDNSSVLGLSETYNLLVDKQFSTKDTDVAAKNLFDWRKNGLLPFSNSSKKDNQQREKMFFSFPELVWVKIVTEMRDFGLSYANIIKVKEKLFAHLPVTDEFIFTQKKSIKAALSTKPEIKNYAKANGLLENDEKMVGFGLELFRQFNLLQILLMEVLNKRTTCDIYVLKNGDVFPLTGSILELDQKNEVAKLLGAIPSFRIPINPILANFIADEQYSSFVESTTLLNKQEQEVIAAVRDKSAHEIVIQYKDERKTIDIVKKKKGVVDKEEVKKIVEEMLSHPYQSISFTTNKSGQVNIQKEKRKRVHV